MRWLAPWLEAAGGLLYPPACVVCQRTVPAGEYLCGPCAEKMPTIREPACRVCSQAFAGVMPGPFTCAECEERRFAFECNVSARRLAGLTRDLVHRFKYGDEHYLRRPLGHWLAEALACDLRLSGGPPVSALVPVPLHPRRRRERGFDQAEALCRVVAKRTRLPVWNALRRVRYTETQTRLARSERLENLRGAFAPGKRRPVGGAHLILVDDVFTTGATVDECARVLRRAGAASVRVLTVARR